MKYRMITTFWYDEDDAGLLSRLERLFKLEFFQDSVLRPRSDQFPPTRSNLEQVLQPDSYETSDFRFVVNRGKKSLRGTLNITRNTRWSPPGFTSFLELSFSLAEGYKNGPFYNVREVRDIMLACVQVGPSPMGFVECEDKSNEQHNADFERFRIIDSMAVPVTFEWISVLHKDVVARMGVDLVKTAATANVAAGLEGEYWWIILSEEPFSFLNEGHVQKYRSLKEAVGLEAIHAKFPRR